MASTKLLNLELSTFLRNGIPISSIEFLAAIVGTYYLKTSLHDKMTKFLVIFLWITFFIELLAWYAPISYFTNFEYFGFIKDTPFQANYWIYNIYLIGSFSFYIYYFNHYIRDKKWKVLINYVIFLYSITAVIYVLITDVFFKGFSQFTTVIGTLILFFSVLLLFYQVLRSDLILKLKKWLPLYVAIGVLIFNLCITPIDIFSEYFKSDNTFFVKFKANIDLYANLFLYLTLILGFLICSKKKKSY